MKFLDLFAGIGGFRLGMEQVGHECVGYVEIDKFSRKSYEAIHNTEGEWTAHDITTVTDESIRGIGSVEVICGGFPCQAFSVAGKRKGFEDTRGTLFFEIMRFASILRPRYLFLENVGGLINHDGGDTFETILRTLDEVGYDAEWDVLNSKNFGVPQNRERVFIIGHLRGGRTRKVFPIGGTNESAGIKIIGTTNPYRHSTADIHSPDGIMTTLCSRDYKQPKQIIQAVLTPDREEKRQNGRRFKEPNEPMFTLTAQDKHGIMMCEIPQTVRVREFEVDVENLKETLRESKKQSGMTNKIIAERLNKPLTLVEHWFRNDNSFAIPDAEIWFSLKGLLGIVTNDFDLSVTSFIEKENVFEKSNRVYDSRGIAPTLTRTSADEKIIEPNFRIRKLTPRECWRLQGFSDWAFDKAQEVNSDSQLYKQAGNSVTVNVIYEIAKRLS